MFQNLGDGTYYHSGTLAVRSAVASGANITYKILVNDAIAMTGGQEITGKVRVDKLSWQVHAEGANKVVVVSDYPDKYPDDSSFAPGVTIHHRDQMDSLQNQLKLVPGVSVIIYESILCYRTQKKAKERAC